ncbi:MAG: hypothetical protein ABI317_01630, partial [Gaiellales bacterium]
MRLGTGRTRDGRDDREAEASAAAAAGLVGAAESFEGAVEELGWEAIALVGDVQLDSGGHLAGAEFDRPGAVAQAVFDQVAECLLEPQPVSDDRPAGTDQLDRPARQTGPPLEAKRDRGQQIVQRDWLAMDREHSLLDAGEQEQVIRQLGEPVGLLAGRAQRLAQLGGGVRLVERELDLGLEQRERRAQLMTGVSDEAALTLEAELQPFPRRLQPREHLVQSSAETTDLVPPRGDRQPLARFAG